MDGVLSRKSETTPFDLTVFLSTLWEAKWELLLPFIVLGGILSGIVTLDEAAALTAIYACIVEMGIHRSISLRVLPRNRQGEHLTCWCNPYYSGYRFRVDKLSYHA